MLSDQSSAFTLENVEVNVTESESDDSGAPLSTPATIGIAVGASVLGLVPIILLSAILVCVANKNKLIARIYTGEKTVYLCCEKVLSVMHMSEF